MQLQNLLTLPQNIAVVGLSDKPDRPSYRVASYLIEKGFTIIPVNPMIKEFQGIQAYPSITSIPVEIHIDIVDIFRKSEEVEKIVQEVVDSGRTPLIWMQEGVISEEGKKIAEQKNLPVVMDTCIMKVHQSLRDK